MKNYIKIANDMGSTCTTIRGAAQYLRTYGYRDTQPVAVTDRARALTALSCLIRRDCAPAKIELGGHGRGGDFCGVTMIGCDSGADVIRSSKCQSWSSRNSVATTTHSNVTGDRGGPSRRSTLYETVYVPSFAAYRGTRLWLYREGNLIASLCLPRALRWHHDELGICARPASGIGAAYHPTVAELTGGQRPCMAAIAKGRSKIAAGIRAEKAEKARKLIDARELANVGITLADSLAAGNCEAGTVSYARQCGIDIDYLRAGYPIPARILDTSDARVQRAARIALQRETCVAI
jgi:hypothetical protein